MTEPHHSLPIDIPAKQVLALLALRMSDMAALLRAYEDARLGSSVAGKGLSDRLTDLQKFDKALQMLADAEAVSRVLCEMLPDELCVDGRRVSRAATLEGFLAPPGYCGSMGSDGNGRSGRTSRIEMF